MAPLEDDRVSAELVDASGNPIGTVTGVLLRLAAETLENRPATAAVTSVAASTSVVTLLAANTARRMATVSNDSNKYLYLKLGTGASVTSYTVKIDTDEYYELPFPAYTGIVTAIWQTGASGAARITEIT